MPNDNELHSGGTSNAEEQMGKKSYTDKEKNKMVDTVDALRKNEDLTLIEACAKADVPVSLYSWWKGRRAGKYQYPRKPVTTNEDLGKSIGAALNELNSGAPAVQSRGRVSSRRALLTKLYKLKSALMELEQELMPELMENDLDAE